MSVLASPALRPRWWRALLNVAVFQAAWFACVSLAAQGAPGWGLAAIAAAVVLHLTCSDRPRVELALLAVALATGLVWDTMAVRAGWIAYAAPGPLPGFVPGWVLGLWALFATTLREPLRWLHARPGWAVLFGAVGGPLSYAAGVRLGACRLGDPPVSMLALGLGWAVMTPMLLAAARRLDAGKAAR